jgi:serine/threonine protein phosphatase PrpC
VVAAIADGLGGAAHSNISAIIAVEIVTEIVSNYIPKEWYSETLMA